MIEDAEGKRLDFGDRVEFRCEYDGTYQFTIEEINSDGWIWGSDIPEEHRFCQYGYNNFHSNHSCYRIKSQPWGNSKIEFRFI